MLTALEKARQKRDRLAATLKLDQSRYDATQKEYSAARNLLAMRLADMTASTHAFWDAEAELNRLLDEPSR